MSGLPENTVVAWRGKGGEYSDQAPFLAVAALPGIRFRRYCQRNRILPTRVCAAAFARLDWILRTSARPSGIRSGS